MAEDPLSHEADAGLTESVPPRRIRKYHVTCYLTKAFDNQNQILAEFNRAIDTSKIDFDTIVVTGLSGTIIGPIVAYKLHKNLMVVRKEKSSHSDRMCEGRMGSRWLFFDDQICSGRTLGNVMGVIAAFKVEWEIDTEYVGSYSYGHGSWMVQPWMNS